MSNFYIMVEHYLRLVCLNRVGKRRGLFFFPMLLIVAGCSYPTENIPQSNYDGNASSLSKKLFASPDSPGSRALCAAEHSDCPPHGPLPTKEWIHVDVGDNRIALGWCTMSPWRGDGKRLEELFSKSDSQLLDRWRQAERSPGTFELKQLRKQIPTAWVRLADQQCTENALEKAKAFEREMVASKVPVNPAFLVRAVDLWNQRPVAAKFYVPALKKELSGLGLAQNERSNSATLERALRNATIEAFRENGNGPYITGGSNFGGLFAICRKYPGYRYLQSKFGPIDTVNWKRGCIAHNQNGRTDRIKAQLRNFNMWSFEQSS